jgi:Concanavalin A-like lectin/glucanases superfamily
MTRAAPARVAAVLLLAPAAVLAGCGREAATTGIVAEVSTDLAVPAALDEVRVTVTVPGGAQLYSGSFHLGAAPGTFALPMRVGFVPEGGTTPIQIEASGWLRQAPVVSRAATLGFVTGKVVLVPLPLLGRCAGVSCGAGDTCLETGACGTSTVDPAGLPVYRPGLPLGRGGAGGAAGTGGVGGDGGSGGSATGGSGGSGTGGSGGSGTGGSGGSAAGGTGGGAAGGTGGGAAGGTGGGAGTGSGGADSGAGGAATDGPPADLGGGGGGGAGGRDAAAGGAPGGLNAGLIGYWTFDEPGTTYPDRSGNGNDARLNAAATAPTWLSGPRGGDVRFVQGQSWLEVAPSASLNTITSAFTMGAWIFIEQRTAGIEHSIVTRQIGAETVFGLGLAGSGAFEGFVETAAPAAIVVPLMQWTHVAATYDGALLILYVSGVAVQTYSIAGPPLAPTQKSLILGARNDDFAGIYEVLGGQLDEVVVYDRALSAAEVAAVAAGTGPMPQ